MEKRVLFLIGFIFLVSKVPESNAQCISRDFGYSSFVCVCNSTYCNYDGSTTTLLPGRARIVTSSRDQYRNFEETVEFPTPGSFNKSDVNISIYLDSTKLYQSMIGFGGAFTDAASINMLSLSDSAADNLLRMYFAEEGNRYNLVRVPIAGSDFSVRPYSYDDVEGDVDLEFFSLQTEDYDYKLPTMRRAIELCPEELYIFGSPWAPPAWMKSNGMVNGSGVLLKEYWQTYSDYLVKFIEAYEEELGVELWGLTPQNEPLGGFDPNWAFNTCGFSANDMRDWIGQNLGPTLEDAGYGRLNLMVDDFNRSTLPWYIIPMVTDETSSVYVDGVAIHWYDDFLMGPENLDETHDFVPDKFMLITEACEGAFEVPEVMLGSWERGERYIIDILENINHWVSGWVDWNLVLDMIGGPNWVDNFVDSPVIVDAEVDEFYVQPMYYALSLFSRNVQRGANRIYRSMVNDYTDSLRSAAFLNPDGNIVVIIANLAEDDLEIGIADQTTDYLLKTTIGGKSWAAITFNST